MTQSKDNDFNINLDDLNLLESQSSDHITISIGNDMVLSDTIYTTDTGGEYTFNTDYSVSLDPQVEFENSMPSAYRINEMCKHYPALNKAWENFKTIYKMVDQDYKGNFEDDIPF